MRSRLLRPSARQIRHDFDKSAYVYDSSDVGSTLEGLGIAVKDSESKRTRDALAIQSNTISELNRRISHQDAQVSALYAELADSNELQNRFERERANMLHLVGLLSEEVTEDVLLPSMRSYLADISSRVQSLTTDLAEGWSATRSLKELVDLQKTQLNRNEEMLSIIRDRIISNIPNSAGVIFTCQLVRKRAPLRRTLNKPQLAAFDEAPELHEEARENLRMAKLVSSMVPLFSLVTNYQLKKDALSALQTAPRKEAPEVARSGVRRGESAPLNVCGVRIKARPNTARERPLKLRIAT